MNFYEVTLTLPYELGTLSGIETRSVMVAADSKPHAKVEAMKKIYGKRMPGFSRHLSVKEVPGEKA